MHAKRHQNFLRMLMVTLLYTQILSSAERKMSQSYIYKTKKENHQEMHSRSMPLLNYFIDSGLFSYFFKMVYSYLAGQEDIKKFQKTYQSWSCEDFQQAFEPGQQINFLQKRQVDINMLFGLYHMYQFAGFRDYLQTFRDYHTRIIELEDTMCVSNELQKKLSQLPGMSYHVFCQLIHNLADTIRTEQANASLWYVP